MGWSTWKHVRNVGRPNQKKMFTWIHEVRTALIHLRLCLSDVAQRQHGLIHHSVKL